jgi:hypothetical protein
MSLSLVRWVGFAAMLGGLLGVVLGPVLAHLWNTYSHAYTAYGRVYFLSLPPELLGLYALRKLRGGGTGALERWGFRLLLVGTWLMVIGVFTDYWVDLFPGFLGELLATPFLLAGFMLLGIGLYKATSVPSWISFIMVGAVVGTFPVTFYLVNHMPGGPLLLLHAVWIIIGYVLWSDQDTLVEQPSRVS